MSTSLGRGAKLKHYALLAILCTVLFLLMESYLLMAGYGLLWRTDGVAIYYALFVYEGKLLRNIARALMAGTIPSVPLYTFFEGYGADAYVTMSNSLFDPFNLLSAFFPTKYMEYGFYLTMLLRLIGTAWTFSMYCFHKEKDPSSTLVGSLSYATCGFVLMLGLQRHPKFLNFALLIPLLLIEADRLFEGKRDWRLSIIIALAFIWTPVFTWMLCVLMLGYCLIKYAFMPRARSAFDFFTLVGAFIMRIALGFALGAVVAAPVILELMSESRVTESSSVVPLFYTFRYYMSLCSNIIGISMSSRTLYAGIVPFILVLVFIMNGRLFDRDEHRAWSVGLFVVGVMLVIPWFGSMFNGFNYVTDRWMPIASFCFSYIVVLCVPVVQELDERRRRILAVVLFLILAVSSCMTTIEMKWKALYQVLPCLCFVIAVFGIFRFEKKQMVRALSIMIIVPAALHLVIYGGPVGTNYAEEFVTFGKAWKTLALDTAADAAKATDMEPGYRYSQAAVSGVSNGALTDQVYGIDFCLSMYNQPVDDFRNGLEVANNKNNHRYAGNDGRLAVDLVSGAKYFIAKEQNVFRVPASFEEISHTDNDYYVYETDAALGIAFLYDKAISRETYDALNPAARQEALLQGCVVDEVGNMEAVKPVSAAQTCPFELSYDEDNMIVEEGSVTTRKGGCTLTITTKSLPESETYLRITDLRLDGKNNQDTAELFGRSFSQSPRKWLQDAMFNDPTAGTIKVKTKLGSRTLTFPTPEDNVWSGRDDWCINLGYSKEPIEKIVVTFSNRGIYTFSEMEVVSQPVEPLLEEAKLLQKGHISGLVFGTDSVAATFTTDADNTLAFFSIPYSRGWRATVDGQPASVIQANVGFMAVQIETTGSHHVELHYRTPGLLIGAAVTVTAAVGWCALTVRERRKSKAVTAQRAAHVSYD